MRVLHAFERAIKSRVFTRPSRTAKSFNSPGVHFAGQEK